MIRQDILRFFLFFLHFYCPRNREGHKWEGKPAFGVYVNGDQIGNIPAEQADYVNANFSRLDGIVNIEVYGGGDGQNYGAEITLRFRNE